MRLKEFDPILGPALARGAENLATGLSDFLNAFGRTPNEQIKNLSNDWNRHWTKLVRSDPSSRQRYGQEFKKWVATYDPATASKVVPQSTINNGRPNPKYMRNVLTLLAKVVTAQAKKTGTSFKAGEEPTPTSADDPKKKIVRGTVGTGDDGQEYTWQGANWINNKNNKIKPRAVTVSVI